MIRALLKAGALAAALLATAPAPAEDPEGGATAIFVVIENGATVQNRAAVRETLRHLLGQLTELRRRRATRAVQISIILTANPTTVTWSGTPAQLLSQAAEVMEMIAFRETCSDLVLAWEQVETTLRITAAPEYRLYAVGPGIHAGFPCSGEARTVTLPQAVPAMRLGDLDFNATVFKMFNLHPDQDEMFLAYAERAGILARADDGHLVFDLLDAARTRAQLADLL
jgi:hypothetical protein